MSVPIYNQGGTETAGTRRNSRQRRSPRYDAFISYSHQKDRVLADALQSELQTFARPWYRPRALRIFRDETNLSATPGLWPTIECALEASDWFVLMASPASAHSPWVQKEIDWWVRNRATDRILLAVTDGDIRWGGNDFDWTMTSAIPPQLSGAFAQEPLWIDLRKVASPTASDSANAAVRPQLGDIVAEFAAPIRQLDKDTLVGEHIRYKRKTQRLVRAVLATLTVLLVVAIAGAVVAVIQARIADVQRGIALLQRDIATSRQLAANAELAADSNPQLATLLSSAAFVVHDTPQARISMLRQLNRLKGQAHSERFLSPGLGPVTSVSFSPDGRLLAAGGEKVSLWDWTTGTLQGNLPLRADWLAFSPRGDALAVLADGRLTLWDVARKAELASFHTGEGRRPVAFSPDGQQLAIGGIDNTAVVVWDIDRQAILASLVLPPVPDAPPEGHGISALTFSPDGQRLLADANYGGTAVWDVRNSKLITRLGADTPCGPISLAVSPEQQTVATGCSGHSAMIILWNMDKGTEVARLQADGDVDTLAFSADGLTLASGDAGGNVALWDMAKRTRSQNLTGHTKEVNSIQFGLNGDVVASGSDDTNVIIWRLGSRNPIGSVSIPEAGLPVAFNPSSSLLVTSAGAGGTEAAVWDVAQRTTVATMPGTPIGFTAERQILLMSNGTLSLWDIGSQRSPTVIDVPVATIGHAAYGAIPVALSHDGRVVAIASGDGTSVVVWDITRNTQIALLPAPQGATSVSFGPAARTLAVAAGGPIVVWDVHGSKKLAEFTVETLGGSIVTVALSSDGQTLASLQPAGQAQTASGCFGCEVILWDVRQASRTVSLLGHASQPGSVGFSPDGEILVSSDSRETILWSVSQRAPMITLESAPGPGVFSADARKLATAGNDEAVVVWDADPDSWRRQLCAVAGRDLTASEWETYVAGLPRRPVCTN